MKKPKTAARTEEPTKIASQRGKPGKVVIRKMPTGVRGLDDILGGGIPEFSFNIIAGTPGCGKTTLAHQILFANATAKKPALYFTVLGEPAMKMLRYQQQYSFFDDSKLGKAIRFINLADVVTEKDLDAVFQEIARQVAALGPNLVVVDSFRTVVRKATTTVTELEMQSFVQRLAQFLTGWEATTFLVGEYVPEEVRDNPVLTVADGLIWLSQVAERNSVVRKLQVVKLRGQASVPGLHTIRISEEGLQAFSRTLGLVSKKALPVQRRRLARFANALVLVLRLDAGFDFIVAELLRDRSRGALVVAGEHDDFDAETLQFDDHFLPSSSEPSVMTVGAEGDRGVPRLDVQGW